MNPYTLTAFGVGAFIGLVAGIALENYERDKTALSPADNARDLCIDTATRTTFPTLYVEGKGCVILVVTKDKGARS